MRRRKRTPFGMDGRKILFLAHCFRSKWEGRGRTVMPVEAMGSENLLWLAEAEAFRRNIRLNKRASQLRMLTLSQGLASVRP